MKRILPILILVTSGNAYLFFGEKIPNGENVPHPCKPNYMWKGVGHKARGGGGARNPFGEDFLKQGKVWSESLCRMDSDGDGRTNGQELGDPDCLWKEGAIPNFVTGITHPGVCEPMNSTLCLGKNTWVDCSSESFECEAIKNDPDVRNITLKFPETVVPADETSYYCMTFELPQDGDYHMIATEPIIDNLHVMHHILLFGCTQKPSMSMNKPETCGMGSENCFDSIGGWTVGSSGECFHDNIGFLLGQHGYKYGLLQFHWNNPQRRSDYKDGSGLMIHYTPNKRIADAGVLIIGQNYFEIPPRREEVVVTGQCDNLAVNGTVYLTRALNHMHYLGRKMKIEQFRGGRKIRYLTNEDDYNYDSPKLNDYTTPIEFKAGDTLKTTCTFKSTGKTKTVFYGDGTNDEMCLGFLTYYPKQNIKSPFCVPFKEMNQLSLFTSQVYGGCRHWDFLLSASEEIENMKFQVIDNCRPLRGCLSECLTVMKTVKKHACMKGDIGHWVKNHALYSQDLRVNRTEMTQFYLAATSCDREFHQYSSDGDSRSRPSFYLVLFMFWNYLAFSN